MLTYFAISFALVWFGVLLERFRRWTVDELDRRHAEASLAYDQQAARWAKHDEAEAVRPQGDKEEHGRDR